MDRQANRVEDDARSPLGQESEHWDQIAPQWTDEIFNSLQHDRKRVITTALKLAAFEGASVADFGCGIGVYLPVLSRLFARVHGFDHSAACIRMARRRFQGQKTITLSVAGETPKQFRGRFDAVLCVNTALHPKRKIWQGILRSTYELLKPGGALVLVVPALQSAQLLERAERGHSDIVIAPDPHEKGGGARAVSIEGVPTKHYTRDELLAALKGLGFTRCKIQRVEYSWPSQGVKPTPELRHLKPWDWLVTARR